MFAIVGTVIVLVCVIGGYILERGSLSVLFQPIELLIIGGAATGAFITSSPKAVIQATIKGLLSILSAKDPGRDNYMEILQLMFEFLSVARREGVIAIEDHVNKPDQSKIFSKYPHIMSDHHLRDFICDNLKAYISGSIDPPEFETLMDIDIEAQHEHASVAPGAIAKVADGLPALGIVAAVLGVVLTMGKIKEPPEVLGHSIGAALVGTFLGVLLAYGVVGPLSANLENRAKQHAVLLNVAKAALMGLAQGVPPMLAVEFARRAIPGPERPSFEELENALKFAKKGA
ncbi:MAG: flagellar motor stator protein MotA [Deltaproteobacteria bacterium]|nr:flagellar motor stator protein MotA [Deltaproteobacteria bacterium]